MFERVLLLLDFFQHFEVLPEVNEGRGVSHNDVALSLVFLVLIVELLDGHARPYVVAGLVHDLLVEDCDILAFHSSQGGTILGTLCFIKSLLVLLGMRVELLSTWPLDERLKHLVDPGVADFAVVTETSLLEMSDEGAGGEVVTADGPLLIGKHEYHGIPGVLILKEPAACTGIVEDGRFYLLEGVMVDRAVFNQDSLTCPYVRHINPF